MSQTQIAAPFEYFLWTFTPYSCFEEVESCVSTPAKVMSVIGAPLFLHSSVTKLISASVHFITHLQNSVVEVLWLVSVYIVPGSADRLRGGLRTFKPHVQKRMYNYNKCIIKRLVQIWIILWYQEAEKDATIHWTITRNSLLNNTETSVSTYGRAENFSSLKRWISTSCSRTYFSTISSLFVPSSTDLFLQRKRK